MGKKMRCGYTTGSCAAAAAKAALLAYRGHMCSAVEIALPDGEVLCIPIEKAERLPDGGRAAVIKDGGDDPDITHGAVIIVEARLEESPGVRFCGGEGVGTVTKNGLSVPVGEPAINPTPRRMIQRAVQEVIGKHQGCCVNVSIPAGAELAKRTLNPTLGIVGGLSVIGTSGIVRPMSEEAFRHSLTPQIDVARAAGLDTLIFVPGKIGENAAASYGLPRGAMVQTSNFIGFMLESAAERGVKRVLLFGHLGKLAKVAAGVFHTHNRMADARMETLAAYLAAAGAPQETVRAVLDCTTTEAAMPLIGACGLRSVYQTLAERAAARAQRYVFNDLTVGVVIVTLKGELLGMDGNARKIGEDLGWNITSL